MPLTIKELAQKIKDSDMNPELQKIYERGRDGCFTDKESETFDLLIAFIRNESNSMISRACGALYYDMMMGESDSTVNQWCAWGEEAVVKDFIESIKDC